jgi:hypothetical protein
MTMGWQPEAGGGTGPIPDRGFGAPIRDPRLNLFAGASRHDAPVPSGHLALLADELSGLEDRCLGATADERAGLLRAWTAIESWAAARKLGVVREMMRHDGVPSPGAGHGDLPESWSASLRHELALLLACSVQSADTTAGLAWDLQARLPGIGTLLGDGTLTQPKARAVADVFRGLSDQDAADAEALILDQLPGKTYPQVLRLAEQAALTVDPELAERRRREAQKDARVSFFRETAGTAGLSGRDLPPDEALAAMASVNTRAQEYADSGRFGDARMDVLRATAYLDLLNGVTAETRIASAEPYDEAAEAAESLAWSAERAARAAAEPAAATGAPSGGTASAQPEDNRRDDEGGPGDSGPGPGGPGGSGPGSPPPDLPPPGGMRPPRPADLIVPLATLLGSARRPGEVQGFGPIDPALARLLADAAAASPHTNFCVTVTSPEGFAVGHGCARAARRPRQAQDPSPAPGDGLPTRLNLTVSIADLPGLAVHAGPWSFTPSGGTGPSTARGRPGATGPPGGYGLWTMRIPGGREFSVRLDPVPTFDCGHEHETRAYVPGARLRHLVQVRDGTCTFPSCNRHARESDFEHALPYDQGGRTCACNAGARSRTCHRVKQSPGWNVTQPQPGWHQWTTPSGRVHIQEPKRYPA